MAANAVTKFIAALRRLVANGLSKDAAKQFAKNEFGEISKFLQKRIDDVYKNPKGEGIENIKIKDEVFDDTVVNLPIDDTGQPFNPNNPLKDYSKELTDSPLDDLKKIVDDFEPIGPPKPKKSRMLDEDEIAELDMDIGGLEYTNDFDGTVGSANKLRKERAKYIADMELEYKKGNLDPGPGEANRKKFLQDKFNEMEASGDTKLMTRDEIEELSSFDLQTDMDKAVKKFKKKDAKQKKIIKDFDPGDRDPSADGGRAGFYTGGITDVEPNLSDIGHGSDSLMARTRLMSPGSQATTSTGLNYLLAEDNDNLRVPFAGGGIGRRAFLKLLASLTGGVAAAKSGILSLGGKGATKQVAKEIITTPAAAGKPAWFDALVTRVIREGDDVTKTMATKDREIVHATKVDDDAMVTVYRDLDDGTVRVDIDDATTNVIGEQGDSVVSLEVKGGQLEEGVKGKTPVEFEAREADYRNYMDGPDDYTTETIDNVVGDTKDLTADLTKVKMYAKGQKKPTIKEMMIQRDRAKTLKQAEENPAEYAADRGPDIDTKDYDYASGGIARMIGE